MVQTIRRSVVSNPPLKYPPSKIAFSGSIAILNDRYGWAYTRDGDRYTKEAVFVHGENANPNFGAA